VTDAPPRPAAGAERARRWGPLAAWASLLLLATSWPNPSVPDVQGGDKVTHTVLYGVLAYLAQRAGRRNGLVASLALVGAVSAFGWADEWHQQFIPGRTRSVADWQADTAGAAAGVAASLLLRRRTLRLT
jgi:VanZ family protein